MKSLKTILFLVAVSIITYSFSYMKMIDVDPAASAVTWKGYKVTGSHEGTMALKNGSFEIDNDRIIGGAFTLDMTTVKCTDLDGGTARNLDRHLMSDDFFGVKTYPTAKFVVTSSTVASMERSFNITGDLTIKGITHPISFVAQMEDTKKGVICTAQLKVDRTKYGIKYKSGSFFTDLGDRMIYDEFDVNIRLVSKE